MNFLLIKNKLMWKTIKIRVTGSNLKTLLRRPIRLHGQETRDYTKFCWALDRKSTEGPILLLLRWSETGEYIFVFNFKTVKIKFELASILWRLVFLSISKKEKLIFKRLKQVQILFLQLKSWIQKRRLVFQILFWNLNFFLFEILFYLNFIWNLTLIK